MTASIITQMRLDYPHLRKANLFLMVTILGSLLLLLIILPQFVPFSPKMPAAGLDASWALALNQAIAQGLSFGTHIIFTLGPYSSIYTKAYHPATDLMMMTGSCYLAFCYWISLLGLMRNTKWYWNVIFSAFLLTLIYAKDALLFSYPLLAALHAHKLRNETLSPLLLALLFSPLGLLPLIKGSLLILCSLVILLCTFFFALLKDKKLAFICLVTPCVSLILFWIGAGQPLTSIGSYLLSSLIIASGFSEAMGIYGNRYEVIFYLLTALIIMLFILGQRQERSLNKLFLFSLFTSFLFLSFKAAFTRHLGHAYIASTAIMFAALLLSLCFTTQSIISLVILSFITGGYINNQYTHISLTNNFFSTYAAAWYGFKQRIEQPAWLNDNYNLILHFLGEQQKHPSLPGTCDSYSYDQTYLIAAGGHWNPRPVIQSYSVFTPFLAAKNEQHLLQASSPDTVIFRMAAIDNRFPALEDGRSWPVLLSHYHPIDFEGNFLFLRKKDQLANQAWSPHQSLFSTEPVSIEDHRLGEEVFLPHSDQLLFAQMSFEPTLWGKLLNLAFKSDPLHITVTLANGIKKQFRLNAAMAEAGFLLSPFIENTRAFANLYYSHQEITQLAIHSFSINAISTESWHWKPIYTFSLRTMPANV